MSAQALQQISVGYFADENDESPNVKVHIDGARIANLTIQEAGFLAALLRQMVLSKTGVKI